MKYLKSTLLFLLFAVCWSAGFSQQAASTRVRTYDVQHYIIHSKFDRLKKTYYGDTTIKLKPLSAGFNTLVLDAAGMTYESVAMEGGARLEYKQAGEKLTINLGREYAPSDLISVRIRYSSKPKKGVYFVDAVKTDGKYDHSAQVWTQGEAEEAHHWFPSYDFPDDKATSEQFLTTGKDEVAVANGELIDVADESDGGKTFHYKMPLPHSVYLTSFVIGNYAKVTGEYKNIPLGFYVYPGREGIVEKAYGKTPDMMRVFEEITGVDYPYNKYDQTIVARFTFGGMENITVTTMADAEILMADFDFGRENAIDLVSHELAHSWFGNLVTCKNWSELWLNEGFATFMEAAYREKLKGRAEYLRKIREDAGQYMVSDMIDRRHALFNAAALGDDTIFDTTTYQKGGAVVATLRAEIGDEAFWKGINAYLMAHKFDNVESTDLRKAFEQSSGRDLSWFFNQWVYKAGYPKLSVRQVYNARLKQLSLTVTQTQTIDKITPAAFILPMDVEIQTAGGSQTEHLKITKRIETFKFSVAKKPTKIIFDKDEKIPLKVVKFGVGRAVASD